MADVVDVVDVVKNTKKKNPIRLERRKTANGRSRAIGPRRKNPSIRLCFVLFFCWRPRRVIALKNRSFIDGLP